MLRYICLPGYLPGVCTATCKVHNFKLLINYWYIGYLYYYECYRTVLSLN